LKAEINPATGDLYTLKTAICKAIRSVVHPQDDLEEEEEDDEGEDEDDCDTSSPQPDTDLSVEKVNNWNKRNNDGSESNGSDVQPIKRRK